MSLFNPFEQWLDLAPKFTGEPDAALPFKYIRFLGGVIMLESPDRVRLKSRDVNIIVRAAFGQSDAAISDRVGLTERSTNCAMRRVCGKMGVNKRQMLLSRSFDIGLMVIPYIVKDKKEVRAFGPRESFQVDEIGLEIIRRVGKGLTAAAIGREIGLGTGRVYKKIEAISDAYFTGAQTHFAAAVATGQIDPITCEILPLANKAA